MTLQLYQGDPNAHVVAKKQSYWPAEEESYHRLSPPGGSVVVGDEGSGETEEAQQGGIPMLSENELVR